MKRIFWCLGASALLLSGCKNTNQAVSEPAPQKITEATPITQATPDASGKSTMKEVAPKKLKSVAAFDINKFHLARTLELPYYNDQISGFVFSPDGKTVAGVGRGRILSNVEGGERGVVFLFDVKSGALLKRLASDALPAANGLGPSFDRVTWSPNGKFVVAWNVDSGGDAPLCVWDVKAGTRTSAFRNAQWKVKDVAWMKDGSLMVARNDETNGLMIQGQLMICNGQTGQISNIYDLGERTVTSIHVPEQGAPQLLILKSVGEKRTDREPDVQSSVRSFDAGVLGRSLLQFPVRQAFLGAAFTNDGRVAVCGIEQDQNAGNPTAALYAVGDLNTGKIVWRNKKNPLDFSLELFLSPDAKQFWARTATVRDDLIFEISDGKSSTSPDGKFPLFAPDGKRFVRPLNLVKRGQKPNLKIAQIWER